MNKKDIYITLPKALIDSLQDESHKALIERLAKRILELSGADYNSIKGPEAGNETDLMWYAEV